LARRTIHQQAAVAARVMAMSLLTMLLMWMNFGLKATRAAQRVGAMGQAGEKISRAVA